MGPKSAKHAHMRRQGGIVSEDTVSEDTEPEVVPAGTAAKGMLESANGKEAPAVTAAAPVNRTRR